MLDAQASFDQIKENILATSLSFHDFSKVLLIKCDASLKRVGAILSQEGRPIIISSEKLLDAKAKYFTYDAKILCCDSSPLMIEALSLLHQDFILFTNHDVLRDIFMGKISSTIRI